MHKSLINFSTRPRFTKHWANRSTATDVTRLWPTNFQTIINIHISRIRAKLLFIASHLLTRNCEHPLGPIHLQYLSKVFQHLLERLRRAKVQQDSTLRCKYPFYTCTVWSWLLTIRMTRPEEGFPPPGGGASSLMEAFLPRLATAAGLLCHPPAPPPLLPPPPVGLVYQVLLFFP